MPPNYVTKPATVINIGIPTVTKIGKVMPIDVVRYRLGLAFGIATRTTAGAATNDALPARVPRTMTSPSDIPPKTASNTPIIPFIRGIAIARKKI